MTEGGSVMNNRHLGHRSDFCQTTTCHFKSTAAFYIPRRPINDRFSRSTLTGGGSLLGEMGEAEWEVSKGSHWMESIINNISLMKWKFNEAALGRPILVFRGC